MVYTLPSDNSHSSSLAGDSIENRVSCPDIGARRIARVLGTVHSRHRGASFDAQKTLWPLSGWLWEQQADAIEGDFYLTKDQRIVCIHDATTKRTALHQRNLPLPMRTTINFAPTMWGRGRRPSSRASGCRSSKMSRDGPKGKSIFVEINAVLKSSVPQTGARNDRPPPEQIVIICFNEEVIQGARH